MAKIFIDPGHGGTDPGAVGNGLQEKNVNLQIALRVRDILLNEYDNVTVRMSRTGDQTVSLGQRTNAANSWGADYFLSIHINAGGGTGFESFIYPGVGAPTTTYRNHVHDQIINRVDFTDRGKKTANFHVLRESNMPAVLTENGFIDRAADANKLKTPSFIEALARGHAVGVARAFNLPPKSGGTTLYKVQIGAFSIRANAEAMAADARSKGFSPYIAFTGGLYKVQLGAFSVRANAEALAQQARAAGYSPIIVQE
ncbi:N-acetylmuramoyl-L-alanine amidase [Paenibacillus senegalensis]|uniref:N-acetylmuramoyl-L-alanine amidase n=1 Tax=Paenibacillus senegalensis TaxID=1465766 RepID=UPI000289E8F1|nr:N-acetylmuramoyl-L-alanine amidase [Paenibacillus senegalensis]